MKNRERFIGINIPDWHYQVILSTAEDAGESVSKMASKMIVKFIDVVFDDQTKCEFTKLIPPEPSIRDHREQIKGVGQSAKPPEHFGGIVHFGPANGDREVTR